MNAMAKYALMGVGFTAISTALGADGVRTARAAAPGGIAVNVENTPSVSVVSMPAADPSQVVILQPDPPATPPIGGGPTYAGSTASGKTALVVQNANDAQQPFGMTITMQPQGSPTFMGAVVLTVPAHKRAVIERIGMGAAVPMGQQPSMDVSFGSALPPGSPVGALSPTEAFVPSRLPSAVPGLDGYWSAESVRYYVEPGSNVYAYVMWPTAAPSGSPEPSGTVTISGYFVDAP